MARYVITTRRELLARDASARTARNIASTIPGVTIVAATDPHVVTIDASPAVANVLRTRYADTHLVEPEIRSGLM